ncbi:MAG: HAMP domain-containing histidine kinase [bacterium]|nr:HAMP domain-containing histidine kinase [bacterium]
MKKRYFLKIFSGYIALLTLCILINLIFTINTEKKQQINEIFKNIENIVQTAEVAAKNFNGVKENFAKFIKEIKKNTGVRITIIGLNGTVVMDSEKDSQILENHSDRMAFKQAIKTGRGKTIRRSPVLDEYIVYYAKKNSKFVIRGSVCKEKTEQGNFIFTGFYKTSFIMFTLGIFLSLFFTHLLYSPIKEILNITEKIKSGNFIVKPILRRRDELGKILQDISEIGANASQMKKTSEFTKNTLNQFINTVDFPVGIINVNGDIEIYNNFFDEIIEIEKKHGLWWEKIKNFEVNKIIRETIEKKKQIEQEIDIKGKYFLCKSIPLPGWLEVLLLMVDITAVKNMEKRRKEFLTAVSHELKTPLTAIKGYIETLKEEIKEPEKQKYIDIILHNTERMARILDDIILLTKLESTDTKLEIEEVDLLKIVKDVISLFEKKASQKGLKVLFKAQSIPKIKGDAFRLEQVLINLIDNAIRFTEKGEIEIAIEYKKDSRSVKIEISDTGIGIEKEHLPHIFERFYVVDKSRSRKTGGTGLGLSIVKSIVLLHNGKIDVESTYGKGTKFIITLPV